jgi:hypothetical protein
MLIAALTSSVCGEQDLNKASLEEALSRTSSDISFTF